MPLYNIILLLFFKFVVISDVQDNLEYNYANVETTDEAHQVEVEGADVVAVDRIWYKIGKTHQEKA